MDTNISVNPFTAVTNVWLLEIMTLANTKMLKES